MYLRLLQRGSFRGAGGSTLRLASKAPSSSAPYFGETGSGFFSGRLGSEDPPCLSGKTAQRRSAARRRYNTRSVSPFALRRYQVHDCSQRKDKDDGGDGVDFRRDAAAQASPDFERQRIVAADQEKADSDFVHRKREDQQRCADDRQAQVGQSHAPEGLPVIRTQIERSLFLGAVEFLQAGEDFRGGHRNERRAVAQNDGQQAQLHVGLRETTSAGKGR